MHCPMIRGVNATKPLVARCLHVIQRQPAQAHNTSAFTSPGGASYQTHYSSMVRGCGAPAIEWSPADHGPNASSVGLSMAVPSLASSTAVQQISGRPYPTHQ